MNQRQAVNRDVGNGLVGSTFSRAGKDDDSGGSLGACLDNKTIEQMKIALCGYEEQYRSYWLVKVAKRITIVVDILVRIKVDDGSHLCLVSDYL